MGKKQETSRTVVNIYGQEYTIVGKESSDHVIAVAKLVDRKMKELKNNNPYLDSSRLAVLTAVNISHEYLAILSKIEEDKKDEEKK